MPAPISVFSWEGRTGRRDLRPALRHGSGVAAAARAVAVQRVEPLAQIDVVAAEPALTDDRGDLRGYKCRAFPRGVDHHAGKPRRQRQPPQMPALIGDAAVGVDGAERGEERIRLGQRRPRRRIEEGELFR